jgi:hypothetical protein
MKRGVVVSMAGVSMATAAYLSLIRPWYRNWGATREEIERPMPLDERIHEPTIVTTRGVTVHARPEQIWPWIVQMGEPPRAGFYSYTWIERLQGLQIENTDRVLPEYQRIEVGASLDEAGNMKVLAVEPGRFLALGPPDIYDWLQSTWVIALYPVDEHATRLVTRVRAHVRVQGMLRALPPTTWPLWVLIDPGVFVMERKMLLEIKRLAEAHASEREAGEPTAPPSLATHASGVSALSAEARSPRGE